MRPKSWLSCCAIIATLLATPTHALAITIITLEPDKYAVGTNVTNLFEGVTLNRYSVTTDRTHPTLNPVYVEAIPQGGPMAATGTQVFGRFWEMQEAALCWRHPSCRFNGTPESFSVLLIQFDHPTNFVEIAGTQHHEGIEAVAWDANGQGVSWSRTFFLPDGSGNWQPSPTHAQWQPGLPGDGSEGNLHVWQMGAIDQAPSIQTVIVGGFYSSTYIDTIRYSVSVPEPSSLILMGAGILLFFGLTRKRWLES